jgi:uncharacterized protein YjbJ (UPF0337 family)
VNQGVAELVERYRELSERKVMKSSLRDRAKGVGHMARGKAREIHGRATNNPDMEEEGMGEQIAGKAQQKVGQVKKVFGH